MKNLQSFLEDVGLGQYFDAFQANDIDLSIVGDLENDDLKEIGISSLGHRRKLLAAFRQNQDAATIAREPDSQERAERREVTTVFADLTGYSKLSRELDAEDLHAVLGAFYEETNAVIARMGGTVSRHIGDCVMAVFGAPVSHGNDAERALRATIDVHRVMVDLSRRFGHDLSVHIGVASGNVLFARQGYGERKEQDFTLTGDRVNFASRLADEAKGGETLISDNLFLSLSHKISCDAPLTLEVKGFEHPMLAHRFLEFRDQVPQRQLIGRDQEVEVIQDAIAGIAKTGRGRSVFLCGEAGIGKSRLLEEATRLAIAADFKCYGTLILDFGQAEALSPLHALLRNLCGLGDAPEDVAVRKVVARLAQTVAGDENFGLFLTKMLGGDLDRNVLALLDAMNEQVQLQEQLKALRRVLCTMSADSPLLLAVEDLHWASAELLPSIDLLVAESARNPILVLVTTRPEGPILERSSTGADELHLDLKPLTDEDAMALASFSIRPPEAILKQCIKRAQGNPLFLEQLLRHTGEDPHSVPGSIQSLIQNRFDRLDSSNRQILQGAAVLGQKFSLTAATEISGVTAHDVAALIDASLIRPTETGYLFAHALIRDAVLRTMLRDDRRKLHRAAASWFQSRDPLLYAKHLGEAQDPLAAGAFLDAARATEARFNKGGALGLAEQGLASNPDAQTQFELFILKGNMLRETGQSEAAIAAFEQAQTLATTASATCRAQIGLVATMRIQDRMDEAFVVLDDAQALASAEELIPELSEIHYFRGCLHFPRGNLKECLEDHTKSLDFAKRANLHELQARALSGLGDAHYARGAMFTAHEVIEDCLNLCDVHGFGAVECANRFMLATVKIYMNQTSQALDHALRSAELAAQVGLARPEIVSRLTAGWIHTSMADYEAGRRQIEKGLAIADKFGAKRFEPFLEETLARIAFATGNKARAGEIAEGAHAKVVALGADSFIGAWVLSTVALTTPDDARRVDAIAAGEAILAQRAVGHNYFRFYRNAMQACLNAGELDEAWRLADALEDYTAKDPTPWSDFHIARTRGLVAVARGEAPASSLAQIEAQAKSAKLFNALESQLQSANAT